MNNQTTSTIAQPVLTQTTLLLMATACGLCAGANYFNQPLLNSMVQHLHISDAQASSTVTMAQVSYGLGLLFLVPLGDMLERRRLVLTLMLLAACGMLLSGISGMIGRADSNPKCNTRGFSE